MSIKERATKVRIIFKQDFDKVFKIKLDCQMTFTPGQFLSIGIDTPNGFVVRPYSIVSSPQEPYMEFYIAVVNDGKLTPHLSALSAGDFVYVLTPKGHFTYDKITTPNMYFVATGTGIAPFISMLRYVKNKNSISVIWGNSFKKDFAPYQIELIELLQDRVYFVPSREDISLRIPDYLKSFDFVKNSTIMACGNPNMTKSVLDNFKDKVDNIIIEDYWKERK